MVISWKEEGERERNRNKRLRITIESIVRNIGCLLYTSDAADE